MLNINICIIHMHFRHYSLRIKISFEISFQSSLKLILIKKFHWTFSRVPWNFLNNIWTTPVVPWNSMELEQQNLMFHGIPWNFVQIQSSMEFHGTFSILPSSMEFHGIPLNLINFIFKKIAFLNNIVFGIWFMIRCYLAKISQKRYILHWFQYRNSYFEHPSVSENGARSVKMKTPRNIVVVLGHQWKQWRRN